MTEFTATTFLIHMNVDLMTQEDGIVFVMNTTTQEGRTVCHCEPMTIILIPPTGECGMRALCVRNIFT